MGEYRDPGHLEERIDEVRATGNPVVVLAAGFEYLIAATALALRPVYNSAKFRIGLAVVSGQLPIGYDAHHMFPQKIEEQFSAIGTDGIEIHNPLYGAWWKAGEHRQDAYEYNKTWEEYLRTPDLSIGDVFSYGRIMAKKYGLSTYY